MISAVFLLVAGGLVIIDLFGLWFHSPMVMTIFLFYSMV